MLDAVSEAWSLLRSHPLRWIGVIVLFLVAVEALMFIPYVGFVLKLAVASVLSAHVLGLFARAAVGEPPNPLSLFSAFAMPSVQMATLVIATLLPFAIGVLYLELKAGPASIEFFFGNILKVKPPPIELFVQFKYVLQLVGLPFMFVAGAVVLKGLSGAAAFATALSGAATNWLPILLFGMFAVAFEWLSGELPQFLPGLAAVLVSVALLFTVLALSFAFTYTISARALGAQASTNVASQETPTK